MFYFGKNKDERLDVLEQRVTALETAQHKRGSEVNFMIDNLFVELRRLDDEMTIAKNILITRKHAEIKKNEDPLVKVAPHDEVNSLEKQLVDARKELADEKYKLYLMEKQLKNWLRKYKKDTGKDPILRNRRNRVDREKEAQMAELALTIQKEGVKDEHLPRP